MKLPMHYGMYMVALLQKVAKYVLLLYLSLYVSTIPLLTLASSNSGIFPVSNEESEIAWAKARKERLLKLMETNPQEVVDEAFSKAELLKMPEYMQPYLEQRKAVNGILYISIACNVETGYSKTFYHLKTREGEKYLLHFVGKIQNLSTGDRIRIRNGIILDTHIVVPSPASRYIKKYSKETSSSDSLIGGSVTGDRKIAVIMYNFADDTSEPFTKEEVRKVVFDDTKDWYDEVTFGKLNISGYHSADGNEDIYGWYTISQNNEDCESNRNHSSEALEMAEDRDNFKESDYTNIIYLMQGNKYPETCGWGGLAQVGSITTNTEKTRSSWLNGGLWFDTVVHELGHNFGMDHASGYYCYDENGNSVSLSNDCETSEYGDYFDVMGNGFLYTDDGYYPYHMNSLFKTQLGWLEEQNIQTVEQDGTFTIFPIEKKSSDVQALAIRRGTYMASDYYDDYYFLEYRRSYGYDNFNEDPNRTIDGILIRLVKSYDKTGSTQTFLIDMTPGTDTFGYDHKDATLLVGKTFEDDIAGITIKTVSISEESAEVEIAFSGTIEPPRPKCEPANPSISIDPSVGEGYAGDRLKYIVTVKNNDTEECGSSAFHLESEMPEEIQSTSFLSYSAIIGAGQSKEKDMYVTSSGEAAAGSYVFTVTTENASSDENYYSSTEATYVVLGQRPEKPNRPDQFNVEAAAACDDKNKGITITWEDTGAETYYELVRSGGLNGEKTITLSENTVSYTDTDVSEGYSYKYKIQACNDAGCSSYTSTKSAKAPASECVSLIIKKTNKGDGSGTIVVTNRTDYTKVTCDLVSDDDECEYKYEKGTRVKLRAKSSSDSKFKKWAGDCEGSAANCSLNLKTDKEVEVKFVKKK